MPHPLPLSNSASRMRLHACARSTANLANFRLPVTRQGSSHARTRRLMNFVNFRAWTLESRPISAGLAQQAPYPLGLVTTLR